VRFVTSLGSVTGVCPVVLTCGEVYDSLGFSNWGVLSGTDVL